MARTRSRKHHIYVVWWKMIDRCTNNYSQNFRLYGGRGITVCAEWFSFERFIADMGIPEKGLSIERIDNNKGYNKENCIWATQKQQVRNQRRCKLTEPDVVEIRKLINSGKMLKDIAKLFNVDKSHISKIKNGHKWS